MKLHQSTAVVALGLGVFGVVAPTASAGLTVALDPLLEYNFDGLVGPDVVADTGTAPNTPGILTGGAALSSDTPGGFSNFAVDLSNDSPFAHVLSSDAADLDGLGQITLTTWLKVNQYTSGNNRLVAKQDSGNFGGFSWNMNATTNDGPPAPDNFRLALFLGGDNGFVGAFSDGDVSADEWAFLAVTYDTTTETVSFYQGGETTPVSLVGTPTSVTGNNPGVIDANDARFGVGFTDAAPSADVSVDGLQDDVRVYGRALGLADLEAVRLSNVPEPGAVAMLGLGGLAMLRRRG